LNNKEFINIKYGEVTEELIKGIYDDGL